MLKDLCAISEDNCGLCIVVFRNGNRLYVKTSSAKRAKELCNKERLRQRTRIMVIIFVPKIAIETFFDFSKDMVFVIEKGVGVRTIEGDLDFEKYQTHLEESENNCGLYIVALRNKERLYVKTVGTKSARELCKKEKIKQQTKINVVVYIPRIIIEAYISFYEDMIFTIGEELEIVEIEGC